MRKMFSQKQVEELAKKTVQEGLDNSEILPFGEPETELNIPVYVCLENTDGDTVEGEGTIKAKLFITLGNNVILTTDFKMAEVELDVPVDFDDRQCYLIVAPMNENGDNLMFRDINVYDQDHEDLPMMGSIICGDREWVYNADEHAYFPPEQFQIGAVSCEGIDSFKTFSGYVY